MSLSFVTGGKDDGGGGIRQVLIGEAVADVAVEVSTLGFRVEELSITLRRHLEVEISFCCPELDLEATQGRVIDDRR